MDEGQAGLVTESSVAVRSAQPTEFTRGIFRQILALPAVVELGLVESMAVSDGEVAYTCGRDRLYFTVTLHANPSGVSVDVLLDDDWFSNVCIQWFARNWSFDAAVFGNHSVFESMFQLLPGIKVIKGSNKKEPDCRHGAGRLGAEVAVAVINAFCKNLAARQPGERVAREKIDTMLVLEDLEEPENVEDLDEE